jgi:hypothetical protein
VELGKVHSASQKEIALLGESVTVHFAEGRIIGLDYHHLPVLEEKYTEKVDLYPAIFQTVTPKEAGNDAENVNAKTAKSAAPKTAVSSAAGFGGVLLFKRKGDLLLPFLRLNDGRETAASAEGEGMTEKASILTLPSTFTRGSSGRVLFEKDKITVVLHICFYGGGFAALFEALRQGKQSSVIDPDNTDLIKWLNDKKTIIETDLEGDKYCPPKEKRPNLLKDLKVNFMDSLVQHQANFIAGMLNEFAHKATGPDEEEYPVRFEVHGYFYDEVSILTFIHDNVQIVDGNRKAANKDNDVKLKWLLIVLGAFSCFTMSACFSTKQVPQLVSAVEQRKQDSIYAELNDYFKYIGSFDLYYKKCLHREDSLCALYRNRPQDSTFDFYYYNSIKLICKATYTQDDIKKMLGKPFRIWLGNYTGTRKITHETWIYILMQRREKSGIFIDAILFVPFDRKTKLAYNYGEWGRQHIFSTMGGCEPDYFFQYWNQDDFDKKIPYIFYTPPNRMR